MDLLFYGAEFHEKYLGLFRPDHSLSYGGVSAREVKQQVVMKFLAAMIAFFVLVYFDFPVGQIEVEMERFLQNGSL